MPVCCLKKQVALIKLKYVIMKVGWLLLAWRTDEQSNTLFCLTAHHETNAPGPKTI